MKKISYILIIFIFLIIENHTYAQTLLRGPYLTQNTQDGIIIHFNTDVACIGKVQIGTTMLYGTTFVETTATTNHQIKINGLTADTKYYYSIGSVINVIQTSNENFFKTLPIADKNYEQTIRLWAVGDMSKATNNEAWMRDAFIHYVDTNYINAWILLGDNAYNSGTDIEYQTNFFNYYQHTVTKHIPLLPCLGNHDYANDYNRRVDHIIPYFDIFTLPKNAESGGQASATEQYYSADIGNVHCIQLDSYGFETVNGTIYWLADTANSPQITWLKKDLDSNKLPWVIVSFHHPPYAMGTHNSDIETDLIAIRQRVNPILERYNVDLVLSGHCHTYQRSNFIKNHFGLEATFDSTQHIMQLSNGHYDNTPNSCAYYKNTQHTSSKDSGLLYITIGSGSALPTAPQLSFPHNAMSYSNWEHNGSLLLTIKANKLQAEWISTDTIGSVVKDKFTMYKNIKNVQTIYAVVGDTLHLSASWYDTLYTWNTNEHNKTIQHIVTNDTVLTVADTYGCFADTFQVITSFNTGVKNIVQANCVLYPNPVIDNINITCSSSVRLIELYDVLGCKINSTTYTIPQKDITYTIPKNVPTAVYIIKIHTTDKQVLQRKVFKL